MERKVLRGANPRVELVKGLLSRSEVRHLLSTADPLYRKATVVDHESGASVKHKHRTGDYATLRTGHDSIVSQIETRLAELTGARVQQGESIQVIRYKKGQQYKPHYDWFDPNLPGSAKQLQMGGQRIGTVLMCLQKAQKGGETEMPHIGIKLALETGDALMFTNVLSSGAPDPNALHAGLPVKNGIKVVATRWVRQRASDGSEEEQAKLSELKRKKEQECFNEIGAVLRKHGCHLYAKPTAKVDASGGLALSATIELEAVIE